MSTIQAAAAAVQMPDVLGQRPELAMVATFAGTSAATPFEAEAQAYIIAVTSGARNIVTDCQELIRVTQGGSAALSADFASAHIFVAAAAAVQGPLPVPAYAPSKRQPGAAGFLPDHIRGINRAHSLAVGARQARAGQQAPPAFAQELTRALHAVASAAVAISAETMHLWPRVHELQRGPRPPALDVAPRVRRRLHAWTVAAPGLYHCAQCQSLAHGRAGTLRRARETCKPTSGLQPLILDNMRRPPASRHDLLIGVMDTAGPLVICRACSAWARRVPRGLRDFCPGPARANAALLRRVMQRGLHPTQHVRLSALWRPPGPTADDWTRIY